MARIPVTPFDSDICRAVRERCIDQPEAALRLEAIADRLMHRAQMRNFGKDKMTVVNHTVDADGNGKAGVRWYEFQNHKDRGWELKKENTFSPDGNVDQFVQLGTAARWGDYSAMAIDPVDDTCWYTQEYARPNTRLGELAGWATKIVQFDLKGVGNAGK